MSRHRDRLDLHYAREDFADRDALVRTLSRDRARDMASDYAAKASAALEVLFRDIEDYRRRTTMAIRLGIYARSRRSGSTWMSTDSYAADAI